MDIEDAVAGPGDIAQQAGNLSTIGAFDIGNDKIFMDGYKAEMSPIASLQLEMAYQRHGVDITKDEIKQISALQVELGAAKVLEIFSPK
eukprot:9923218-Heterocapsa_arctica.AAC.1